MHSYSLKHYLPLLIQAKNNMPVESKLLAQNVLLTKSGNRETGFIHYVACIR